ncbi:putative protein FAR1-RELATED SEQUENCE 10 [Glycine soja]
MDYFVYVYVILVNSICNMDEDQWTYDNTMSEEVDMDFEDEQYCGVNEGHVFATRDDVLHWARTVAHENGFVAVIMRSNTYTGSRGRTSFVLIVCERSSQYKCRKKEFVRRDTGIRKYGCPFKLRGKPLICGIHNHEFAKTLVGHPYARRLTNDEKNIIADMTKSNEHNANNCTTIKQIYNARSAYHSSIRGDDTEMQHLMRLLERDQYIHGHRMKDEVVVCDLFWCHPDAVKLCNACHLVFFIDSTYKTNRYRLLLLDFVEVTPTGMTFSVGFAYLEGERVNNIVWALERFRGLFLRNDRLPVVIVTDRDLALMNALKIVFLECTNLLCRVESAHWALKRVLHNSLGDLCSVWDAINNMIMLQHAQIKASFETSTHVVGHVYKKTLYKRLLGMVSRYALNEIAYEFERVCCFGNNPSSCGCVLRTTLGLPCACELQRYDGGSIPLDAVHMYWRRLSFSDQGLCEAELSIKEEMDRIYKRFEELDVCGKVTFKSKLREFAYPDENSMCPPPSKVNTTGAPKKVMKRSQRSIKRDPSYWDSNKNTLVRRTASSSEPLKPARMIPMLDQFAPFIQGFIEDVVDVKADGNYGYQSVAALTSQMIARLHKPLWWHGEQLRLSLHVDGLSKVSVDKWMDITEMRYVIVSRYNVILVSLSQQQSFTFFPLRSQPPPDSSMHHMICVGHVFGNHFVQVYLKDRCPLPPMALLWSINSYPQAKNSGQLHTWNMPRQNNFVEGCTIDELKDLIKQVALKGNPPHGIHESQLYSDKVLKFEIIELKIDDDVLKVLVESNYWKQFVPIEILAIFSKPVMENEDEVVTGVSSLSSFSIPPPFIFQEAKESIDEEDPRPTSSNGAYIMWYQEHLHLGSTPKDPLYKILYELRSLKLCKEKQERKEKDKKKSGRNKSR